MPAPDDRIARRDNADASQVRQAFDDLRREQAKKQAEEAARDLLAATLASVANHAELVAMMSRFTEGT